MKEKKTTELDILQSLKTEFELLLQTYQFEEDDFCNDDWDEGLKTGKESAMDDVIEIIKNKIQAYKLKLIIEVTK